MGQCQFSNFRFNSRGNVQGGEEKCPAREMSGGECSTVVYSLLTRVTDGRTARRKILISRYLSLSYTGWLFDARVDLKLATLMSKSLDGCAPSYLSDTTQYDARRRLGLVAVFARLMQSHLSYRGQELVWATGRLMSPDCGFGTSCLLHTAVI